MTILTKALNLTSPELVTLVGSGGKTTLMFALAEKLAATGLRVLTTTTTKIYLPTPQQSKLLVLNQDSDELANRVEAGFKLLNHVTAGRGRIERNKLLGLPQETVDEVFKLGLADIVIVEADGARGLPLKAPNAHEPVVPQATTLLVPILGLSGLGQPLDEATVFRSERFAELSGLAIGDQVSIPAVAKVLMHPEGLVRDKPAAARMICFLNQADALSDQTAQAAALTLLSLVSPLVDKIIWGSLTMGHINVAP